MKDDENDDRGASDDEERDSGEERNAKDELFEAIDHFKNAASILFDRATKDPAVKSATKEAERVVKKIGSAAEPLAKQLTSELGRLTRDVRDAVEGGLGTAKKKGAKSAPKAKTRGAKAKEGRDEEE